MPRQAIVLTAGLGTRLRPLTTARAKPAIPVGGTPMIQRIVGWLVGCSVTELVLNLHHLPETLTGILGDGRHLGANVRYSWEPDILGSAGGPKRALPILGASTFFVVNGDTITDADLTALAADHERSRALVTLALVPNVEPLRYGGVLLDAERRVTGFVRRGPAAEGSFHFIGVQVAHAEAFATAPADMPSQSIGGIYDDLLTRRPGSVRGVVCDASFADIGTMADYLRTSNALGASSTERTHGRGVRIAPTARVTGSILWDDVDVGEGCTLDECIVTDGVRIPANATYQRKAIVRAPSLEGAGVADVIIAPITD
jgi:mannose-1-phosphate guanylyltransferase